MSGLIEARTLKGFRDYPPEAMLPRERMLETARRVYRSYGFAPIDTPALEYLDVLLGKGSQETDKQLYKFEDPGGRMVGLRFDLTVPFARFAAQHIGALGTPFKRYHMASVWRGENTQRGRYREFMQCDFDTIGTQSLVADIETALVIHDLVRAIGFDQFTIRVNNRQVLNGLLSRLGLAQKSTEILRALDKLGKVGPEKVEAEMCAAAGATPEQAAEVLRMASLSGSNDEILRQLEPLVAGNELGEQGVANLAELLRQTAAAGISADHLRLDVSIARGLDYYTGTIYETFLGELPGIGSICSGGRYDNLAGVYTRQELPGVGASLGLDRLLAAMEELGRIERISTPAELFIPYFESEHLGDYLRLAHELRAQGLGVEVYPEPRKLGVQLKYADKRGYRFALVIGGDEFQAGQGLLKDLSQRSQTAVPLDDPAAVARTVRAIASASPAG